MPDDAGDVKIPLAAAGDAAVPWKTARKIKLHKEMFLVGSSGGEDGNGSVACEA
jgi:hypothetical protein